MEDYGRVMRLWDLSYDKHLQILPVELRGEYLKKRKPFLEYARSARKRSIAGANKHGDCPHQAPIKHGGQSLTGGLTGAGNALEGRDGEAPTPHECRSLPLDGFALLC